MKKRPLQIGFADIDPTWHRTMIPAHVVIIETNGKSVEEIVTEMVHIPMDKSMVLDFTIGHVSGSPIPSGMDEDRIELIRLQRLLNSRVRGKRFNWLGTGLIHQAIRESLSTGSWNPFQEQDRR